ncbi:MAG: hypothetical protein P4L35_16345 [Ignavibacteriaceae bacterium]|nr:hypothetical protein [Ignavibacteriaceae bacterium]
MNTSIRFISMSLLTIVFFLLVSGCKKSESPTSAGTGTTYPVNITIVNLLGQPQGGALVALKNAPSNDAIFQAYTDSAGKATLQAPAGTQTFTAEIGSAFLTQFQVNVSATAANNPAPITLTQNAAVKVLVVTADAEQLEDVISDPKIGFTTFSTVYIDTLKDMAIADSAKLFTYLQQFTLVFSDCDGSTEGGADYANLSRVYGRYIQAGGKMYGGHYNYYHLQRIWTSSYRTAATGGDATTDSLVLVDTDISKYVGFSVAKWNSTDYRGLSGYELFSDLPANAKMYGKIKGVSPDVFVIVENHLGSGKYLWTNYHNQDIKDDPKLIKLVQYFLKSL